MKALNLTFSLLIISSLMQTSCKQITKSINDTFKPDNAALKQQAQKQGQTNTTSATTTQHIQSTEVIVNGDTLNTKDMEKKTKALFKDLETLQKNKTGNNSKEIQEKVNAFLKDINIQQKADSVKH